MLIAYALYRMAPTLTNRRLLKTKAQSRLYAVESFLIIYLGCFLALIVEDCDQP